MAHLDERQHAALMANAWFAAWPQALREEAVGVARERRLAAGERLYRRGDVPDGWYGLVEGAIRVAGTSAEGRESVLTFVEPGTWFGEISLFDHLPRTHDGVAQAPSLVLVVGIADFEALLERHPGLCRRLMELQCHRLRVLFALVEAVATQPLECRLARQLLALARSYGSADAEGGVRIALRLPQEDLAQLMGVTRQHVNATLKAWERAGLVGHRAGRLVVLNAAGLQALAER